MAENVATQQTTKRFRSPPYPMFNLAEAVERAKLMHQEAHQHFVGADVIVHAWGLKSIDGKLWRAAAALIQYGLVVDTGSGRSRKFQITDTAKRIILDENPESEKRIAALKNAALKPMINRELWKEFGTAEGLADTIIRTYLTIDRAEAGEAAYSSSAAEEVLGRYRSSIAFAGLTEDTQLLGSDGQQDGLSEDYRSLRIEGSQAGIPLDEVEKVTPPPEAKSNKPIQGFGAVEKEDGKPDAITKKITAQVEGGRLKITADVNAGEIEALQDMLSKYKEILEMLD